MTLANSAPLTGALEGIKILDFTHELAGPACTMVLGILGADVVKVTAPGHRKSYDETVLFLNNASKRWITLDLKSTEGLNVALKLAAKADIVIENFGPGVMEKLGVGYEKLKSLNSRIIYGQIKGFATGSRYEGFTGWDPVVQAWGGSSAITGAPDGPPTRAGIDVGDSGTGMVMAIALLAAIVQRQRTGEGQQLEVAMADQVATALRMHYAWVFERKSATPRFGNRAPFAVPIAPAGMFACKPFGPNDYVNIHVGTQKQWIAVLTAIDRLDLIDDKRFATAATRGENMGFVDGLVAAWTANRTKMEAMEHLGKAGVPVGAVRTTEDILADQELRDRGIFVPVKHPTHGEVVIPGWPVRMSGSTRKVTAPSEPGADTDKVIEEWLGH